MIPQSCDVVVIGGGPAGSVAATLLARKGRQVILLEKQRHPRQMVGESLIPHFWKYMEEIGVAEKLRAEGFLKKAGTIVNWNGQPRAQTFKDFGYKQPAMHVERDRFDEILLRHAQEQGVAICEEVNVLEVAVDAQPVQVHYRDLATNQPGSIECRYVVDASGQNSVVGRQLGLRQIDEGFRFMSVWGYFTGGKYFTIEGEAHDPTEVREYTPATYVTSLPDLGHQGWCWYIILRNSVSVGLVFPNELMKNLKPNDESWEDYFVRRCREVPVVNQLLADARFCPGTVSVTRDYSYQLTQLAGPGYFLVGDAAGFIDPIFSIGVAIGVYSGYMAAWAIDQSLQDPTSANLYCTLFEKQLRGRLEVSRSLALPRYQSQHEIGKEARTVIDLESKNVKKLMYVVSSLTNRSDNFHTLVKDAAAPELASNELRIIPQLNLS